MHFSVSLSFVTLFSNSTKKGLGLGSFLLIPPFFQFEVFISYDLVLFVFLAIVFLCPLFFNHLFGLILNHYFVNLFSC